MSTPPLRSGLPFAIVLVFTVLIGACSEPWLRVTQVPEDGYMRTLNYQFQAQVHADSLGECQLMVVRVRALNKLYSMGAPPSRLQLFDDDCMRPIRFERVHYISNESGGSVRLSGVEVVRFWSENVRLEDELFRWLWNEGVI